MFFGRWKMKKVRFLQNVSRKMKIDFKAHEKCKYCAAMKKGFV